MITFATNKNKKHIHMVNIRKKIKEQGFTLEQVAAKMRKARGNSKGEIGISQPALSDIINGNPTLDRLQEIANIIGISVSDLLKDDTDKVHITCPHCGKEMAFEIKFKVNAK